MSVQIVLPRIVEIGANASAKTLDVLEASNCRRPLVVTDKVMVRLGNASRLIKNIESRGLSCALFDEAVQEPTASSIQRGLAEFRMMECDSVVALGGGSVIDSGKAIAVMARFGGDIRDYCVPREMNEPGFPSIAIPTTAGTGSEVTRFTVIRDDTSDEKLLCAGQAFIPTAALIDFELTMTLPPRVTADSGIDALTHAIEAYVSRKANPYSDSQALSAIRVIGTNLPRAYRDGGDRRAREAMMLGATLAGIAFSNASVALVHGMSRPIGAFFHIPHGLSNAMLLPTVTEYSIPSAPERYADCARALGAATSADSDGSANKKLLHFLRRLSDDFDVPTLLQFGADKTRYDQLLGIMANQAIASGSPANNPRVPSADDIIELYRALWTC